jgi:hypothetical protein
LASNPLDPGEHGLARVDISRFRTVKILSKQSGASGDEYECEFKLMWLAADLVGKMQMRLIQIRTYEKELIRARQVGTLRSGKRNLEEMEAS